MLTHAIFNQLLTKNVRVEIVYENSPVFADEEVSAIVRFRHLGEAVKKTNGDSNDTIDENATSTAANGDGNDASASAGASDRANATSTSTSTEEQDGWFGKRLSMQLSNTARALFLEEAENTEKKPSLRNKPSSFLSGYIQLSGYFTYDEEVVEGEKLREVRTKAAVAGKIGGLEGLELSKNKNDGMFGMLTNGIGNLLNTNINELGVEDQEKKKELEKLVPFFSTSQSLLFSELHLESGDVKTFYFKCKLPKALPPSYKGSSIKINYHLIVGASLDKAIPKPLNIHFPLKIYPNFDEDGYQPISNLDKFILLPNDKILNEAVQTSGRRTSFKTIKKVIFTQPKLTQNTKKEKFLQRIEQLADDKDSQGRDLNITDFKSTNSKEILTTFSENINNRGEIDENIPLKIQKEGYTFEKQVSKIQTQYIISRNGQSITTLTFSKPFYKIGEEIKLSLDFNNKQLKTTGVLVSLESLELIRDSFSADLDLTKTLPRSISYYKDSFPTFNIKDLSLSIPIPLYATSQFKTNIFESRWCLSLKFVLSEEEKSVIIHSDETGEMFTARENMNGTDFICRLPIIVLPSDQDFGGITA